MPVKPCPDCGHETSERASKCPACGGPLWHKTFKEAYSWKGMGLMDLIPGIRDLPFVARLAILALVLTVVIVPMVLFVVPAVIGLVSGSPDAQSLAQQVKPLIFAELQKQYGSRASMQNVTLVHQGGKVYTGFADVAIDGVQARWSLNVTYDRGNILWQFRP